MATRGITKSRSVERNLRRLKGRSFLISNGRKGIKVTIQYKFFSESPSSHLQISHMKQEEISEEKLCGQQKHSARQKKRTLWAEEQVPSNATTKAAEACSLVSSNLRPKKRNESIH